MISDETDPFSFMMWGPSVSKQATSGSRSPVQQGIWSMGTNLEALEFPWQNDRLRRRDCSMM